MKKKSENIDSQRERVIQYGMYSNYIQSIKHFDNMQTFYRMMTSTFLLGSFGAIGFLFSSENKSLQHENILPVLLLCLIGVASILSLWHLDLIFCERLLISNFAEALKLEEKLDWLPKVHHNMLYGVHSQDKPSNVVYFYIGSGSSLILTSGIICIYTLSSYPVWVQGLVLVLTFLAISLFSTFLKKRTVTVKYLLDLLKGKSHGF